MKVAIIGGGPSGLFLALLLSRRKLANTVHVFEQHAADATYGFGVTLADKALQRLIDADAECMERITRNMLWTRTQSIDVPGGSVRLDLPMESGAIERLTLLRELNELCAERDIPIRHNQRIDDLSEFDDYQLVVGADGANSIVRSTFAEQFGTRRQRLTNRFAWYGVNHRFEHNVLSFRRFRGQAFVGHYYPYTESMSTFVAECDERAWHALELDEMNDDERTALANEVFADALLGHELISNRSYWAAFETVENSSWTHAERYVLMGDALYRAHFSIGSGTRLAMEDAAALADAIAKYPDRMAAALGEYERTRRPIKAKLIMAARKSYIWYESMRDKLDLAPEDFTYDFLTRTGRLKGERLREFAPAFVDAYRRRESA